MPKCSRCNQEKPPEDFGFQSRKTGKLQKYCKPCQRDYKNEWYKRIPPEQRADVRVRNNQAKQKGRATLTTEERIAISTKQHRNRGERPMSEAKNCGLYMGVHITENVLSDYFDNLVRMPNGNRGYDFLWNGMFKIDCKSSTLYQREKHTPHWMFSIDKNQIADYFLCLAFDNKFELNPQHIWLIPSRWLREVRMLYIYNTSPRLAEFAPFEHPVDKVITRCNAMKADGRV